MFFVVETNFMHGKHMIVFLTSQENPQSQLMIPFQSTNCYDFTIKILSIKMISFKTNDTFLITLFWNYFWHPDVIKKIYVKIEDVQSIFYRQDSSAKVFVISAEGPSCVYWCLTNYQLALFKIMCFLLLALFSYLRKKIFQER